MIPVDPLTTMALIVLAGASADTCGAVTPTDIKIVPGTKEVVVDTSRSLAQIQGVDIDTINPYGYEKITHTYGFMDGGFGMRAETGLDFQIASRGKGYCLWYNKVQINLDLTPNIVIASEIAKDRCMYRAILKHEMKHVKVDRRIANKFAKSIGRKVYDGLKARGFSVGPIGSSQVQVTSARMRKTVQQIIGFEFKKLEIERAERQQAVDSLEEYTSISAQCPDFRPPESSQEPSFGRGAARR